MNFEERCIAITKSVTDVEASFYNGTMFLETDDTKIATSVYNALAINNQSIGIKYGKCASGETSYDFM